MKLERRRVTIRMTLLYASVIFWEANTWTSFLACHVGCHQLCILSRIGPRRYLCGLALVI